MLKTSPPMSDPINPSHYDGTIDRLIAKHGLPAVVAHFEVDASRYEDRAGKKPDNPAEQDLAKAVKCRELAADMLAARLPQAILPPARLSYIQEVAEALEPLGQGLVRELLADREALGGYYAGRERERVELVRAELAGLLSHRPALNLTQAEDKARQNNAVRLAARRLNISL